MNSDIHDYIEQCPYCKKYLLAKQVKEHKCNSPLRTVKEIPVVFSYITSTDKGDSVVIAMGFDGILYRLVTKKRLSDDFLQRHKSDKDFTEPEFPLFFFKVCR